MKIIGQSNEGYGPLFKKIWLIMKLNFLLILLTVLQLSANVSAQNTRLDLKMKNATISQIFDEIERQSEVYFFYNKSQIDENRTVSIDYRNKTIEEILKSIGSDLNLTYEIAGKNIIIKAINPASNGFQQSGVKVKGAVKNSAGELLPGVSVVIKGTTNGTITDADGVFNLTNVPGDATLVFSFVGMKKIEIGVAGKTTINAVLEDETIGIEEVVAIGYGIQKKVNLTGSVESVEGEKIARQPVVQASQTLTGLVPGLTAIQSSGQPGKDNASLRIRGIGSIGASNDPLILIDGVEGDINSIDANDISGISVLKDAASASIYGSRASNGVILITTKRAKKGDIAVSYKNYFGWQNIAEQPEFLGALDFLRYTGSTQAEIDQYAANHKENPDLYPDTDWVKEVFTENGFQQYHSLSVNGGTDKLGVLANLSYIDQGANIKGYGFTRYNGRFNSDFKLSDKFDINFDINFNKSLGVAPSTSLEYVVRQAYRIPPIYPAVHSDGSWGVGWAGSANPIAAVTDGGSAKDYDNYFRGVLKANYSPLPGLKFSVMYAPENNDGSGKTTIRNYQIVSDWGSKTMVTWPGRNELQQYSSKSFTDNFNALATYSKTYKEHDFSILAGYEFIKYQYEIFKASRTDFILQDYEVLNAGSEENDANSGSATHSGLASYFSRLNYSFKDRYLVEANVRRDASSRFDKANRVGIFPSFSAGWRLSEESFIKNLNLFSNLKLRGSWGQLGNQQILKDGQSIDFPYASSIAIGSSNYVFNDAVATGASQNILANKEIKWETTETTNVGVDAGLLKQRLTFSLEYYVRKTKDILLQLPIPLDIGLNPSTQNAGNVENRGWDFSGNWQDKAGKFSYGIGVNISNVKNEVTNLAGVGPIISGNSIIQVGSPINLIYGYESIGIFQDAQSIAAAPAQFGTLQVGNIQYKDQLTVDTNGDGIPDQADGKINPDDRVTLGNPFPTLSYGINLNAEYKGFDLAVSLQGVGKRDVLIGGDMALPLFNAGKIQKWQAEEFWTPENPNSKYPKISPTSAGSNDIQTSSTWVFNAAYMRVRNITLGYTFPKSMLNKIFVKNLRVYCSGQNLFTFDKLPKGIDPLTPNGTQGALYPITANYIMGIDLQF